MPVLYVTCGWRDSGNEPWLRKTVCRLFSEEGFHLVGDAEDQPHALAARTQGIMSGCSGQLVIIPRRGEDFEQTHDKHLRAEMRLAGEVGLKQYIIVEAGVKLPSDMTDALVVDLVSEGMNIGTIEQRVRELAEDLYQSCPSRRNRNMFSLPRITTT